jgi:hydrogenase large subunit
VGTKIVIDPVNRQEGHIGITCQATLAESNGYRVSDAEIHGNLFRGFEIIMKKRDPRDAMVLTQRHCGVCPIGHGVASSKNIGTAFRYQVHFEDKNSDPLQRPLKNWTNKPLPPNAARLRNLIHVAQHMMSNILHFYHLVALDYVKPCVVVGGVPTPIDRPFLAPRYDDNHYINTARINALAALLPPSAVTTLSTLPGWGADRGGAVNAYLTGQYLKALDIRRKTHEMATIFAGREPICSGYTPGGVTASVTTQNITDYQNLLNEVKAFMGEPTDFANGIAGTMMFDTVAAAHLFPEYFWIGNSHSNFMSFGWGEEAGMIPLTGVFGSLFGAINNSDQRAYLRGWKTSAAHNVAANTVDIMKIGESIAGSRYSKLPGGQYPDSSGFKHPWAGQTTPDPNAEYSWLKSPAYDIGSGNYQPFEVGPLARVVVNGFYWGGILNLAGYSLTPTWGQMGPDTSTGSGHPLEAVYAAIPGVTGGPDLSAVAYNGDSTLDRIAARTIETRLMVDMAQHFLNQVSGTIVSGYGSTGITDDTVPMKNVVKKGYGMTEASRGALSHWIKYKKGKIVKYQAVVPTTWNACPRNVNGTPGPAEQSMMSSGGAWVANPAEAIELPRITHSYDFCIACAVHLITPEGEVHKVDVPALPG